MFSGVLAASLRSVKDGPNNLKRCVCGRYCRFSDELKFGKEDLLGFLNLSKKSFFRGSIFYVRAPNSERISQ